MLDYKTPMTRIKLIKTKVKAYVTKILEKKLEYPNQTSTPFNFFFLLSQALKRHYKCKSIDIVSSQELPFKTCERDMTAMEES